MSSRSFSTGQWGWACRELWTSDGTAAGMQLLMDIRIRLSDSAPGAAGSSPDLIGVMDGESYFTASDGSHRNFWKTDGTPGGTQFVVDLTALGLNGAADASEFRGRLYFESFTGPLNQRVLASTDGTAAGTSIVTPIPDRAMYSSTNGIFVLLGSRLVFAGKTDSTGGELWAVDLNNPPTGPGLQTSTIPENSLAGTTVGLLQSTDLDSGVSDDCDFTRRAKKKRSHPQASFNGCGATYRSLFVCAS